MDPETATNLRVVPENAVPSEPSATSPKNKEPKPTRALPTVRIAFPKQLDALRAWAITSGDGKAVSNRAVSEVVKLHPDTLGLANPFFADVKLLQKTEGGYQPSAFTMAFNQAYAWEPDRAAHKLAGAFVDAWFGEALLPRVRFAPVSEAEALQILAEAVNAGPSYRPQLALVLDFMQAAGLILRDGGQVKAAVPTPTTTQIESAAPEARPDPAPSQKTTVGTAFATTEGQVQFNVAFRVAMSEFAGWEPERITAFFGGIAQVLAAKAGVEREAL
jgi:hypothetical protein